VEFTIDQALQQAIQAHKSGNLRDAEHLYRSILQTLPTHSDANHNLGILAVGLGKIQIALPLLKTALESNPRQGQYWLSYIDALIKSGQTDHARQIILLGRKSGLNGEALDRLDRQLTNHDKIPNDTGISISQLATAISLRESGKFKEAQSWLKEWIVSHPRDVEALSMLSQVYLLDKKDNEAQTALAKAHAVAPRHPTVLRNQARLLMKQANSAEALVAAQAAYENSANSAESCLVLAAALSSNKNDREALVLVEKALQICPDYAEAFASRALIRLRSNDTRGALADAKQALLIKPHMTQLWVLVANLQYQDKNLPGAIEALEKAIESEPEQVTYRVDLGELLRQNKQIDKAVTVLENAVQLNPDNAVAWANFGTALQEAKRIEEAKTAYARALAINPDLPEVASNMGAFAMDEENWEEALNFFDKALSFNPDRIDVLSNRGVALSALRKYKEAESLFNEILAKDPCHINSILGLSRVLQRLGHISKAEGHLLHVLEIEPDHSEAYINLISQLINMGRLPEAMIWSERGLKILRKREWRIATLCIIVCWLAGLYAEAISIFNQYNVAASSEVFDLADSRQRNFFNYIGLLLKYRETNPGLYADRGKTASLVVLGDSHCLSPAHTIFEWLGTSVKATSRFVSGIKMFHLSSQLEKQYSIYLSRHLEALDPTTHLLFTIGEIDCRPDEGIWKACRSMASLPDIITKTVDGYLEWIRDHIKHRIFASVTVQGIPSPAYPLSGKKDPGDSPAFLAMIQATNHRLKMGVIIREWNFLDVYTATSGENSTSNLKWHIDENHLRPDFYTHAAQWIISGDEMKP
jgi:tetratricopeptide (TPR) repeat protein